MEFQASSPKYKLSEMLWETWLEENDFFIAPFFRGVLEVLNEDTWRRKKGIPSIYG